MFEDKDVTKHPDYWRMTAVLLQWDGFFDKTVEKNDFSDVDIAKDLDEETKRRLESDEGYNEFLAAMLNIMDGDVFAHFVSERSARYLPQILEGPKQAALIAMTMWSEGFVLGYEYARQKIADAENAQR